VIGAGLHLAWSSLTRLGHGHYRRGWSRLVRCSNGADNAFVRLSPVWLRMRRCYLIIPPEAARDTTQTQPLRCPATSKRWLAVAGVCLHQHQVTAQAASPGLTVPPGTNCCHSYATGARAILYNGTEPPVSRFQEQHPDSCAGVVRHWRERLETT
jgi:hypothetical protein